MLHFQEILLQPFICTAFIDRNFPFILQILISRLEQRYRTKYKFISMPFTNPTSDVYGKHTIRWQIMKSDGIQINGNLQQFYIVSLLQEK